MTDFRYYFNTPAGFAMPVLQMGYNILDNRGEINAISFHTVGGLQYSIGGCFAFKMTKSGRGLTLGAKYINRSFSETAISQSGETAHKYSTSGLAVTIGFRF